MIRRPRKRKYFLNPGDERNYLSDMLHCFVADGTIGSLEGAAHLSRFETLFRAKGRNDGSILLQQHWAQFFEIRGEIRRAARHREREIELIERLFAIGGPIESMNPIYSINEAFLARAM